jgi:hypothetical protein
VSVPEDVAAAAEAPAAPKEIDHMEALKRVLKSAMQHNGLKRGLRE